MAVVVVVMEAVVAILRDVRVVLGKGYLRFSASTLFAIISGSSVSRQLVGVQFVR